MVDVDPLPLSATAGAGRGRAAILVTSHPGQASVAQLRAEAATGRRPRKDYVALADALDADVIDHGFVADHGSATARAVARRGPFPAAQVIEAFRRRHGYRHVVAWADRLGLPLALAYKAARSRHDVVVISVWLTPWKKRVLIDTLRAHTHIGALVTPSSLQRDIAVRDFGVPAAKVHHVGQRVDHLFWTPAAPPPGRGDRPLVLAVGWEARDYGTLVAAAGQIDADVVIAVGTFVLSPSAAPLDALRGTAGYTNYRTWAENGAALPPNVTVLTQLDPVALRDLYRRAVVVVVPLHDVDTDCGATALAEAMAMAKPLVVTRTRGQTDLMAEGEHGLYVPPADPAALRAAIERLLGSPGEAAAMGAAGRAHVERHHTLDRYVERLVGIVEGSGR